MKTTPNLLSWLNINLRLLESLLKRTLQALSERLRNLLFLTFRVYQGGEIKANTQNNRIDIAIAFNTKGWSAKNNVALQLAAQILGAHSSFSLTQPIHAPVNRAYTQRRIASSFLIS